MLIAEILSYLSINIIAFPRMPTEFPGAGSKTTASNDKTAVKVDDIDLLVEVVRERG